MSKKFLRIVCLLILGAIPAAALLTAAGFSDPHQHYMVTLSRADYELLRSDARAGQQVRGLDIAGVDLTKNTVSLVVSENERELLVDLSKSLVKGLNSPMLVNEMDPNGLDGKYKTSDQIEKLLKDYAATYPQLATVLSIGKSLEGREIFAIKITKQTAAANGQEVKKPAIFFNSMHHAREVMSTEVGVDIIDYLLSNYGKDPKVSHWIEHNEIYVLPMLNVDGNSRVWSSDPWWRKNARDGVGVDINRNYPFSWNTCDGSSATPTAADYRGPSAASEPETNVMMQFVASIHPVFSISFHSFSEIVIYPYGCGNHTETQDVVEPLGRQIASLIKTDDGQGTYRAGIAPDLLYSVDGDDISWMYHEHHVIPYVIEVNASSQGFQPNYEKWRDSTVARVRPGWQLLLDRMDGPALTGSAGEKVTVEVLGAQGSTQLFKSDEQGNFHAIVKPGLYQVRLTTADGRRSEIAVKASDRPVVLENLNFVNRN
jgi:carboxypeptidase T